MITMGIDAGSTATKTVILDANSDLILGFEIRHTGADVEETARKAVEVAVNKAGISLEDIDYILSTGWGRRSISFTNNTKTEIICHAAGAFHLVPNARNVIDIGGQDSKAILMDDIGGVIDFVMNDKCAAGTGRFLETLAGILEIRLDDVGNLALKSNNPCVMSSTCVVFAETEVIAYRVKKRPTEDIVAGVVQALMRRVVNMSNQIEIKDKIVFTGGTAKNPGLVKYLEQEMGKELIIPDEPQIVGALGAALLAKAEAKQQQIVAR